jgi:hypothetical protein
VHDVIVFPMQNLARHLILPIREDVGLNADGFTDYALNGESPTVDFRRHPLDYYALPPFHWHCRHGLWVLLISRLNSRGEIPLTYVPSSLSARAACFSLMAVGQGRNAPKEV